MSDTQANLAEAFRQTLYQVYLPDACASVQVGQVQWALRKWLEREGFQSYDWSIITAWNPGADPVAEATNRQRQGELEARLTADGWRWLPTIAVDISGQWPEEPGAWIPGMDATTAGKLGAEYGQLAVVSSDREGAAHLHWL